MSMQKIVVVGLLAGGMLLTASVALAWSTVGAAPGIREGISIELGRRDFRNYCAACHGIGGEGDGTIGEFLTLTVPDLTRLSKRNGGLFPREKVIETIDGRADVKVHGPRDMPVWGDWFDAEAIAPDTDRETRELIVQERIQSIVNYIETLQSK